jgi:hypothetical protein
VNFGRPPGLDAGDHSLPPRIVRPTPPYPLDHDGDRVVVTAQLVHQLQPGGKPNIDSSHWKTAAIPAAWSPER